MTFKASQEVPALVRDRLGTQWVHSAKGAYTVDLLQNFVQDPSFHLSESTKDLQDLQAGFGRIGRIWAFDMLQSFVLDLSFQDLFVQDHINDLRDAQILWGVQDFAERAEPRGTLQDLEECIDMHNWSAEEGGPTHTVESAKGPSTQWSHPQ